MTQWTKRAHIPVFLLKAWWAASMPFSWVCWNLVWCRQSSFTGRVKQGQDIYYSLKNLLKYSRFGLELTFKEPTSLQLNVKTNPQFKRCQLHKQWTADGFNTKRAHVPQLSCSLECLQHLNTYKNDSLLHNLPILHHSFQPCNSWDMNSMQHTKHESTSFAV